MYNEQQLNTGILIKALYEKYVTGNNSYTIHPTWWDISDILLLRTFVDNGFIELFEFTIHLTKLGAETLNSLFSPTCQIPVEKIVNQLYEDAITILNTFSIIRDL